MDRQVVCLEYIGYALQFKGGGSRDPPGYPMLSIDSPVIPIDTAPFFSRDRFSKGDQQK